jgi:hypothetical protein
MEQDSKRSQNRSRLLLSVEMPISFVYPRLNGKPRVTTTLLQPAMPSYSGTNERVRSRSAASYFQPIALGTNRDSSDFSPQDSLVRTRLTRGSALATLASTTVVVPFG